MRGSFRLLFSVILLFVSSILTGNRALAASSAAESHQGNPPSPAALIEAVNQLRLENGLNTLTAHPALMQAAQWEAEVINHGAPGHTHPPGLTLGQWLITLGYPLAGDISQDGLRSENWTAGTELTVDEAIQQWLGDAPHTNTMLSPSRTDIGAGVAVRKDSQGNPIYTLVIETAMQTSSGEQQWEAEQYLTSIPETQSAVYGDATQAAAAAQIPQFIRPVVVGTARPDGDVIHKVDQGQTLWAIAIAYGVKIDEVKRLNNLTSNEVWVNQELLIQKGATQPAPTAVRTEVSRILVSDTPEPNHTLPTATATEAPPLVENSSSADPSGPITSLSIFIGLVVLVGGSLIWLFVNEGRKSPQ